jgi:parallel beta-helix repeat protein
MQRTAEDLGPAGRDQIFGYGLVDAESALRCVNISGNVLESVFNAPILPPPGAPFPPEVRVTSIEGPPGIYTTNENTALAGITPEGDYHVWVPQGVYSICAMAFGYIPTRGLGGERVELRAFDFLGQLNTEYRELRLVPFPCNVTGTVTDSATGLPIKDTSVSLDGPPHIYPPHPNVHMDTNTDSSGNYSFILEYGVHPPYPTGVAVYDITVSKEGYQTQTQSFTLDWGVVVTNYYERPLDPNDYNPPIVNFSLPPVPSELPDLTLARDGIQIIFNDNIATISATIHNIGTVDASNIVVQFFDGDPDAGGTQKGTDQIIAGIAHESTGTAQMTWTAIPGTHDIFVRVDPYNSIEEASETNNQASKQITVSGAITVYVDDDFTDDLARHRWNTIQEGINDANDGDTVLVYNGIYNENVVLNKTLTLIGEGTPKIDAHGSGDAFAITADASTVKGFTCVNAYPFSYAGIRVESNNNVIVENTCRNNYDGIYLLGTSNEIRNNIVKNNQYYGIRLQASDGNIIMDNTAKGNGTSGIRLKASDYNRITDNNASNTVNYNGISVNRSNNNEFRNNLANNNHQTGIRLWSSNENIIANNTAKNNGDKGIYLQDSNNNSVTNSNCSNNNKTGIYLTTCCNNRITDNDFSNSVNYHGISLHSSNNNEIYNNIANSNHYEGIGLWTSSGNIIVNNIANSNNEEGIICWTSSENILTYNNVSLNEHGIWLYNYSTENIVANNTATANSYGISVIRSSNNNIYLNNFVDNLYNAYSYNSSNIWRSASEITYTYKNEIYTNFMGNYWSDYKGSDTDGDGIGGSHYSIGGDEDICPLMKPWESYFAL